jgi:hypothetical protein
MASSKDNRRQNYWDFITKLIVTVGIMQFQEGNYRDVFVLLL